MASSTILTDIQQAYNSAASGWYNAVFPYANKLFFSLLAIELCWVGVKWAIQRDDASAVIMSLLRHLVAFCLFYALLLNGQSWFSDLINSFQMIGADVSNMQTLNPSLVIDQGLAVARGIATTVNAAGLFNAPLAYIVGGFACIIVILSFGLIAAQLLITLIEANIVMGAGILLLGFGGSSWTKSYAERFISYAMSVGIKLFVIYLIIGVGVNIAKPWGDLLVNAGLDNVEPLLMVAASSVVFASIAWQIPSMAASMLSGNVSLSVTPLIAGTLAGNAIAMRGARGALHMSGSAIDSGVGAGKAAKAALDHGVTAAGQTNGSHWKKAGIGALSAAGQMIYEGGKATVDSMQHKHGGIRAATRIQARTKEKEKGGKAAPHNPPPDPGTGAEQK